MQKSLHTHITCAFSSAFTAQTTHHTPLQTLPSPATWPLSKQAKVFKQYLFFSVSQVSAHYKLPVSDWKIYCERQDRKYLCKLTSTWPLFKRDSPRDTGAKILLQSKNTHLCLCRLVVAYLLAALQWQLHSQCRTSRNGRLTVLIPGSILPVQTCGMLAAKYSYDLFKPENYYLPAQFVFLLSLFKLCDSTGPSCLRVYFL